MKVADQKNDLVICTDCNQDVGYSEYAYMVKDDIWRNVISSEYACYLCIGCLENRIGRKLTPSDFKKGIMLNFHPGFSRSERLLDRMGVNL